MDRGVIPISVFKREGRTIMKGCNVLGVVFLSVLLSASASAACGGGGYNPQRSRTVSTSSVSNQSSSVPSNVVTTSSTSGFDAGYFHSISGQLHMSGEQAASVIKAL